MGSYGGFLSHRGIPKTMGFNTKMVVHDLDDLGYPHDFGNLHIKRLLMLQVHHCHSATRSTIFQSVVSNRLACLLPAIIIYYNNNNNNYNNNNHHHQEQGWNVLTYMKDVETPNQEWVHIPGPWTSWPVDETSPLRSCTNSVTRHTAESNTNCCRPAFREACPGWPQSHHRNSQKDGTCWIHRFRQNPPLGIWKVCYILLLVNSSCTPINHTRITT